jgi:hypothetical protein
VFDAGSDSWRMAVGNIWRISVRVDVLRFGMKWQQFLFRFAVRPLLFSSCNNKRTAGKEERDYRSSSNWRLFQW